MEARIFRGELKDEQLIIFRHIVDGKSSREIALTLGTSQGHVKSVIQRTCRQLQTRSRYDAAQTIAKHHGWPLPQATAAIFVREGLQSKADQRKVVTISDETKREHSQSTKYNSSAQGMVPKRVANSGNLADKSGDDHGWRALTAHPIYGRGLLFALLVGASAMALGALVSALQGLHLMITS